MVRYAALVVFFVGVLTTAALAQAGARLTNMSDISVGDHWTYEIRDEIEGKVSEIQKVTVTDVANNEVATRLDVVNTDRYKSVIYDKSWNILREGPNRYSPSSGTGIRSPLALNAEWQAKVDEVSGDGFAWIINVNSRVTGE